MTTAATTVRPPDRPGHVSLAGRALGVAALAGLTLALGPPSAQLDARATTIRGSAPTGPSPGARHRLAIDPTFQRAKLTASDWAEGDRFGYSVAVSGDTVVVGSPEEDVGGVFNQGAVYVFVKPAAGWGNMTQTAKLTASDVGNPNRRLGSSVAISGDTIVAGAPFDAVRSNTGQGSAYLFVKPPGGWTSMTQTAKLSASDGWWYDGLGSSVAVSGDTVVAGAPGRDEGASREVGSAYVFVKPAAGWRSMTQTAKLIGVAEDDVLGVSVAVSGDAVVAGAPNAFGATPGSAYVFAKPRAGWASMTPTAKLTASDGAALDSLGTSVAASGDTVFAGAPLDDVGAIANKGSIYVFSRPRAGWASMTQTAKLTTADGAQDDQLGRSVAISGDTVVAGAFRSNFGRKLNQGSAYVFVRPPTGWTSMTHSAEVAASDGAANDELGWSAAVAGDTVVVGSTANPPVARGAPSAYVFVEPSAGWAGPGCVVPNVVGKTLAAARAAIKRGLCAPASVRRAYSRRIWKGRVIAQRPRPRTRLPRGGRVHLVVSRGRRASG